jgi:hypothetical protein
MKAHIRSPLDAMALVLHRLRNRTSELRGFMASSAIGPFTVPETVIDACEQAIGGDTPTITQGDKPVALLPGCVYLYRADGAMNVETLLTDMRSTRVLAQYNCATHSWTHQVSIGTVSLTASGEDDTTTVTVMCVSDDLLKHLLATLSFLHHLLESRINKDERCDELWHLKSGLWRGLWRRNVQFKFAHPVGCGVTLSLSSAGFPCMHVDRCTYHCTAPSLY